jgi:hypothetical protein
MQSTNCFKTRAEVARELNISTRTLTRKLKNNHIYLPARKLISPALCEEIKSLFFKEVG